MATSKIPPFPAFTISATKPSPMLSAEWTPPGNEEWLEDSADVLPSIRMAWIE